MYQVYGEIMHGEISMCACVWSEEISVCAGETVCACVACVHAPPWWCAYSGVHEVVCSWYEHNYHLQEKSFHLTRMLYRCEEGS